MPRHTHDDEEGGLCGNCSGSGEGPADGTLCRVCRGSGAAQIEDDGPDPDAERDARAEEQAIEELEAAQDAKENR